MPCCSLGENSLQCLFLKGKDEREGKGKIKTKTMSFCSFASLLGGACGVSSENPNVIHFFDLKDCTEDVTSAHLRSCNI